jgi:hypothetical protein
MIVVLPGAGSVLVRGLAGAEPLRHSAQAEQQGGRRRRNS